MSRKRKGLNLATSIKTVEPKTENQTDYIRAICENDVIICSGPSGSGKSYIAAGMAVSRLCDGNVGQIILTRPIISNGRDFGALPGDVSEKINPYLIPMAEYMQLFLGMENYTMLLMDGKIKYEPLELMRGRTFHNAFMILDEAQNCTLEQIKMFITRMGQGSKVLINGDVRQTDIREKSGLRPCMEKLENVDGVGISKLTIADIQRNSLIGAILTALEG